MVRFGLRKSVRGYYNRPYTATRYRSFRRVFPTSRRAPFSTRGFYGASVRSPVERKVIETASAFYTLDTTMDIVLVNGVATGTDFTQRIGRKINNVSVQLRGFFQPTLAAVSNTQTEQVRCLLIEDSQTNGAAPAAADIFQDPANTNSFMNLNNRERFRVIYDKVLTLAPYNTAIATQNTNNVPSLNVYKKVSVPTVYEGTAGTVGSIASGAIFFCTIGSNTVSNWVLNATLRVRFTDA